jgi:hypothetical protein
VLRYVVPVNGKFDWSTRLTKFLYDRGLRGIAQGHRADPVCNSISGKNLILNSWRGNRSWFCRGKSAVKVTWITWELPMFFMPKAAIGLILSRKKYPWSKVRNPNLAILSQTVIMGRELQKKKNRSSIPKIKLRPKSKKRSNPLGNPIIAANWQVPLTGSH